MPIPPEAAETRGIVKFKIWNKIECVVGIGWLLKWCVWTFLLLPNRQFQGRQKVLTYKTRQPPINITRPFWTMSPCPSFFLTDHSRLADHGRPDPASFWTGPSTGLSCLVFTGGETRWASYLPSPMGEGGGVTYLLDQKGAGGSVTYHTRLMGGRVGISLTI